MKRYIILLLLCVCASIHAQIVNTSIDDQRASNPNQIVAEALKGIGSVTLGVGVPCVLSGTSCIIAAYTIKNPLETNTKTMSSVELNKQVEAYNKKVSQLSLAGYILTPIGAALTIVGIPMVVYGNRIELDIYVTDELGLKVNF